MEKTARSYKLPAIRVRQFGLWAFATLAALFLLWRAWIVLFVEQTYDLEAWITLLVAGIVLGAIYALIALGYTLVYGILFMINFAHGEVMMLGGFLGFFTLDFLNAAGFTDNHPVAAIILVFVVGMVTSMIAGIVLERLAYRPLRTAPRLVPLISAIGASIFLQNAALRVFGSKIRNYQNPSILLRGEGWVAGQGVIGDGILVTYTGILTLGLSTLLMVGLLLLIQRTKVGKAMRAVAEDKETAYLMGIHVDWIIAFTFGLAGFLAGGGGVMWGFHNGQIKHTVGFMPGLKAFTAAVLGGIGNVPGAMLGGFFLGIAESMGPAILGLDFQLKDAIAFSLLVLLLILRPQGILGEVLGRQ
jgi:branched-chain amino acid transport system permease protein